MDYTHLTAAPVPADVTTCSVPMRDGVRLAADLYLPSSDGPHPVVLVRLPYDKDGDYCFMPEIAPYFTHRGYAVLVQDVRGKYRSEGVTEFAIHEVEDGYDTIAWTADQSFCDGRVVMWGDSYFGMTQIAAAASGHPALRAISPRVTGSQLSTVLPRADGVTDVDQTSRRIYFATHYVDNDRYVWPADFEARPLADTFEAFFTALGHRSDEYDHDLVAPSTRRPLTVDQFVAATPVPVLYTIGWYDNCAMWSWHDVDHLMGDPGWAERLHLRLEALDHNNYRFADGPVAEADLLENSSAARARLLPALLDPSIAFFDFWLGRSASTVPKVSFEVVHGDWHAADTWPPPAAIATTFFVQGGENGRQARFGAERPEDVGLLSWTADGDDLIPSISADPFCLLTDLGDLAPVSERADVAVVDSLPLPDDLVIAGPVTLEGRLSADQPSADLFARVLDVSPDGTATLVARGQLRFLELTGPTAFELSLLHTAYRFAAGHRIRLHLGSTDYPEFTFNPGDGADCWQAKRAADVTTEIVVGGVDGLRMTVDVLPPSTDDVSGAGR